MAIGCYQVKHRPWTRHARMVHHFPTIGSIGMLGLNSKELQYATII